MGNELVDFEAGIQKTEGEMYAAEDALMKAGFSEEHWRLIRNYILAAILHYQMRHGSAFENWVPGGGED
jgi:hypothetical protein